MPVKPVKDGDKWCIEDDAGKRHGGCHDSREAALRQSRAINANTEKDTIISALASKVQELGGWVSHAIGSSDATSTITTTSATDATYVGISSPEEAVPERKKGLLVWKGDDGTYYWLARYSNSFRDNDKPPEIISSNSHKRFVKMVDEGQYPYPELWLWHQREWKWGTGNFVAFDEVSPGVGFALAGGTVDKGKEWIAERYASGEVEALVSHGMPITEIVRDQADKSIYDEHQTVEVSPLPPDKAANKYTGFQIFTKENDMALSDEKRQQMADNLGSSVEALRKVEQENEDQGTKAVEDGVEFKEQGDETPKTEEKETAEYVTAAEFEQFTDELVKGFSEVMEVVTQSVEGLKAEIKSLREEKEEEVKSLTPAASIYSRMKQSLVKEQEEQELTDKQREGPSQADPPPTQGQTPIRFVNEMVAANVREVSGNAN
jgi:hypothetical protein